MPCRLSGSAPIRPSNEFEKMTVGVFKIHAAATVVPVDFTIAMLAGISPILNAPTTNASEDLIELHFVDQERIVLRRDFSFLLVEVE